MMKLAQVISEFPKPRPYKYDWKKWLDGQIWLLTDEDLNGCTTITFRAAAYAAAKARNLTVSTVRTQDGIAIQATPKTA